MKKFLLIMPHLKKYRKDFCIYFLFAFIAWIISFILPYISGSYIDALLTAKKQYVYWFTFIVCTLTVINIFFKYMSEIAVGKVNTNIGFQISFTLYEKLKRVSLSYFHSIDTVYLVNRINSDSNDIIGFFTSNILLVITETLTMVLSIALLFYINQCIAIVVVMTMPIYVVLYNIFKKVLYTVNLEFFEQRSQYFAQMTEQLSFIKFIKVHSLFNWFSTRFKNAFCSLYIAFFKYAKINYLFTNVNSLLLTFINAFVIFYGGISVINNTITIGSFTIITF
jgi:ABC-type bacteriocin/lantibiotic exporter with double-glycine peptidase domain